MGRNSLPTAAMSTSLNSSLVSPKAFHHQPSALFSGSAPVFKPPDVSSPGLRRHTYTPQKPHLWKSKSSIDLSTRHHSDEIRKPVLDLDDGARDGAGQQNFLTVIKSGRQRFISFFEAHSCYDLMPNSGKI